MVGQAPAATPGASASPRGLSLERLLELTPLTPEQGVAVGAAVLHRLAVAAEGPEAADLSPRTIRVLPDGSVALVDRGTREADPKELLKAAGRLVCAALGVGVEPDHGVSFSASESVALPVVVLSRAMAVGALGGDLAEAERLFLERAGRFGSPERLECSREELGGLVTRLLQTPSVPARAEPAPASRPRSRWSGLPLLAASTLVVLLAGFAATLSTGVTTPRKAPSPASSASASPPAVQPAPAEVAVKLPRDVPGYAPAAAGSIRSVEGRLMGPCTAGSTCTLEVAVSFRPAAGPTAIAWKLEIFDRCTGETVERAGQRFLAAAGWNHILVSAPIQPPANGAALVVVTTAPSVAASAPVSVASPLC